MTESTKNADELDRFFENLEMAEKGRERAGALRGAAFAQEIAATGKMTIRDITGSGVVSRKTVMKHIEAGELVGRKMRIGGVDTWLFEPEHVKRYIERVMSLTRESRRVQSLAGRRAEAPEGFLTVVDLCRQTGLSRWAIYDAIATGRLPAITGFKGAKIFSHEDAGRFATEMAGKARPWRKKENAAPKPPPRPGPRDRRPIIISDRLLLVMLILDQPGETITGLARDLGVARQTVANWNSGVVPDDRNTARLVAYARGRYAVRVGPALELLGKQHRADYMAGYMRKKRLGSDE